MNYMLNERKKSELQSIFCKGVMIITRYVPDLLEIIMDRAALWDFIHPSFSSLLTYNSAKHTWRTLSALVTFCIHSEQEWVTSIDWHAQFLLPSLRWWATGSRKAQNRTCTVSSFWELAKWINVTPLWHYSLIKFVAMNKQVQIPCKTVEQL